MADAEYFLAISHAIKALHRYSDWREGVAELLAALGGQTGASRVWMFQVVESSDDHYVTRYVHEWARTPALSNIDDHYFEFKRVEIDTPDKRALYTARLRGEVLQHHQDTVGGYLQEEFRYQGIASMLTVPIQVDGRWWGILGFDHCEARMNYTNVEIAALEVGAVLFSGVILRERLHWEATHDYLTRLYNRRFMVNWFRMQVGRPERPYAELGLIIFDVDFFKLINDRHGHQAGDRALVAVADLLRELAPAHCPVGRFGGEEFAVWMRGATGSSREFAETARQAVRTLGTKELAPGELSLSAGVAVVQRDENLGTNNPEELFEALFVRADRALFQAKAKGRDRVEQAGAASGLI